MDSGTYDRPRRCNPSKSSELEGPPLAALAAFRRLDLIGAYPSTNVAERGRVRSERRKGRAREAKA